MKNKTAILLIMLIISIVGNIYLFAKVKRYRKADIKQEKIFVEVSDSLSFFRMQRDSIAHGQ